MANQLAAIALCVVVLVLALLDGCNGPDHSFRDQVTHKKYCPPYDTVHYQPPARDSKGRPIGVGYWYTIHHSEEYRVYTAEHGYALVPAIDWEKWQIGQEAIVTQRLGYWTGWAYSTSISGPVTPASRAE